MLPSTHDADRSNADRCTIREDAPDSRTRRPSSLRLFLVINSTMGIVVTLIGAAQRGNPRSLGDFLTSSAFLAAIPIALFFTAGLWWALTKAPSRHEVRPRG
jgi:hypothetical protein